MIPQKIKIPYDEKLQKTIRIIISEKPKPKKKVKQPLTTWRVNLRGTKLLPRRYETIVATTIHRNAFGDIILKEDGVVVASYNRNMVIGAIRKMHYRSGKDLEGKKEKSIELVTEGDDETPKAGK